MWVWGRYLAPWVRPGRPCKFKVSEALVLAEQRQPPAEAGLGGRPHVHGARWGARVRAAGRGRPVCRGAPSRSLRALLGRRFFLRETPGCRGGGWRQGAGLEVGGGGRGGRTHEAASLHSPESCSQTSGGG